MDGESHRRGRPCADRVDEGTDDPVSAVLRRDVDADDGTAVDVDGTTFEVVVARTLAEFHERATIGIQSTAGFAEGRPLHQSW